MRNYEIICKVILLYNHILANFLKKITHVPVFLFGDYFETTVILFYFLTVAMFKYSHIPNLIDLRSHIWTVNNCIYFRQRSSQNQNKCLDSGNLKIDISAKNNDIHFLTTRIDLYVHVKKLKRELLNTSKTQLYSMITMADFIPCMQW